jgi:hypothetical protein
MEIGGKNKNSAYNQTLFGNMLKIHKTRTILVRILCIGARFNSISIILVLIDNRLS